MQFQQGVGCGGAGVGGGVRGAGVGGGVRRGWCRGWGGRGWGRVGLKTELSPLEHTHGRTVASPTL